MPLPSHRVWLKRSQLFQMVTDAEAHYPNETGGVLMGYMPSTAETVVTNIIIGGQDEIRTAVSFVPDSRYQQGIIEAFYKASGGSFTYIGDWHSHPNGVLALSPTDKSTLRRISKCPEARCKLPVMMVIAGRKNWSAGAWLWRPSVPFVGRPSRAEITLY